MARPAALESPGHKCGISFRYTEYRRRQLPGARLDTDTKRSTIRKPHRVAGILAGALVMGWPCLAPAQTASAPAADTTQLERITVTAERRATDLDTTPAAITALPATKLADEGVYKLEDVVMLVPNTSFTTGQ